MKIFSFGLMFLFPFLLPAQTSDMEVAYLNNQASRRVIDYQELVERSNLIRELYADTTISLRLSSNTDSTMRFVYALPATTTSDTLFGRIADWAALTTIAKEVPARAGSESLERVVVKHQSEIRYDLSYEGRLTTRREGRFRTVTLQSTVSGRVSGGVLYLAFFRPAYTYLREVGAVDQTYYIEERETFSALFPLSQVALKGITTRYKLAAAMAKGTDELAHDLIAYLREMEGGG